MGTKTNVTINGVKYEIDLKRAQELKVLTPAWEPITHFNVGDVWDHDDATYPFMIVTCGAPKEGQPTMYYHAGLLGLVPFTTGPVGTTNQHTFTYEQILAHLNKTKSRWIRNINTQINNLIRESRQNEH